MGPGALWSQNSKLRTGRERGGTGLLRFHLDDRRTGTYRASAALSTNGARVSQAGRAHADHFSRHRVGGIALFARAGAGVAAGLDLVLLPYSAACLGVHSRYCAGDV